MIYHHTVTKTSKHKILIHPPKLKRLIEGQKINPERWFNTRTWWNSHFNSDWDSYVTVVGLSPPPFCLFFCPWRLWRILVPPVLECLYISRRMCVGAILLALSLASPISTLNGLIFTTEPATIVWASAGESGLDVSICSRSGFGLCCCHLRFPGAACSQGGRARLCLTFCICAGHVSSPKRLTRLIGGAFLDGWLRRIREHLLLLGACWLRFFLLRLLCIPDSCLSSKWCSLISETKWPKIATLRSENKLPKIYSTI